MRSVRRLVPTAIVSISCAACASLALGDNATQQQLTAALTDFQEAARGEVALSETRLRPIRIQEEGGEEPVVTEGGRHSASWLGRVLEVGLADRLCSAGDECAASSSVTVVSLSDPYGAREGVFVDARVQSVTDTGVGLVRYTRLVRLRIAEGDTGWRVVAATPLWETTH